MAEAAGFTLAVLPLLISAVENYEVVFRPLVTYCRYAKEAERFTNRLKAQKTVFRNECHLLLSSVCDQPQEVDAMLNVSEHPLHSDMDIDTRILKLLDSSYDTCMSTLKLINDTLEEIGEETKGFGALIGSQVSCLAEIIEPYKQSERWLLTCSRLRMRALGGRDVIRSDRSSRSASRSRA